MVRSLREAFAGMDGFSWYFMVLAILGLIRAVFELLDRRWHLKKKAEDAGWIKHQPRGFSVAWLPRPLMFAREWDFHYRWWWRIRPWVEIAFSLFLAGFALYWPKETISTKGGFSLQILVLLLLLAAMWLWRGYRSWKLAISKVLYLRAGYERTIGDKFIGHTNWPELSTKTAICCTLAFLFCVAAIVAFTGFVSPRWAFRAMALALISYLYVVRRYGDWQSGSYRGMARVAALEVVTHYLLGNIILFMLFVLI